MQVNEYNCAVKHFLKNDVSIYNLMSDFGPVELKIKRNYFASLTNSIISQQLSVHSANAILKRFNAKFGKSPKPEIIVNQKNEDLRKLGLSRAKSIYIKDLAGKILSKEIKLSGISKKTDTEILDELTKVKGIGRWTVHMFLIFVLGRADILPHGDLGIRKAIMQIYSLKILPDEKKVKAISKKFNWSPYSSYASLYLWKYLDGK